MKWFAQLPHALILSACLLFTAGTMLGQMALQPVGAVAPGQTVQFDVRLPLENSDQLDQLIAAQHTTGSPNYRQWLTPSEFRQQFGPSAAHLAQAAAALKAYGLTVTQTTAHGLKAEGPANLVQAAFGMSLSKAVTASGATKVISTNPPTMPAALAKLGAHILTFAPQFQLRFHSVKGAEISPDNEYSP